VSAHFLLYSVKISAAVRAAALLPSSVHLQRLRHQERRIGRSLLRVLAGNDFGRGVHIACRTSRQNLCLTQIACLRSTCRHKVCPLQPHQATQTLRLCRACEESKCSLHCITQHAVGMYTTCGTAGKLSDSIVEFRKQAGAFLTTFLVSHNQSTEKG
jgi:hypothetical protein